MTSYDKLKSPETPDIDWAVEALRILDGSADDRSRVNVIEEILRSLLARIARNADPGLD